MADTLAVDLKASLAWLFQDTLELTTVADISRLEYAESLIDGVGAGEADRLWHDQRTLAAAAFDDLDLGALPQNLFGSAVSVAVARVKALLIVNTSATAGDDLLVGGAAAQAFAAPFGAATDRVQTPAGSCLLLVNKHDGWTVSPGVSDTLRIANAGAGDVTYNIALVGASS